eukprot:m.341295 g.341295  ORF g.341295 m.341295 type:complete len:232 (+) comp19833_c4_seq1:389-1084(+)
MCLVYVFFLGVCFCLCILASRCRQLNPGLPKGRDRDYERSHRDSRGGEDYRDRDRYGGERDRYADRDREYRGRDRERDARDRYSERDGRYSERDRYAERDRDGANHSSSRDRDPRESHDRRREGTKAAAPREPAGGTRDTKDRPGEKTGVLDKLGEGEEVELPEVALDADPEEEMARLMGFGGFGSTKGQQVSGNVGAFTVLDTKKTTVKRKYRQYMNRRGGFNRSLDDVQ